MKSKQQVSIEMRVSSHLKDSLQVRFRFMSRWNDLEACKPMKVRAYDVSRAALCVETEIDMRGGSLEFMETEGEEKVKVLPYLVSFEKKMRLPVHLPPGTKGFVLRGKAIWYELKPEDPISMLRMGGLFRAMPQEARDNGLSTWKHKIRQSWITMINGISDSRNLYDPRKASILDIILIDTLIWFNLRYGQLAEPRWFSWSLGCLPEI